MSYIYVNWKEVKDANYDLPPVEAKAGYVKWRTQIIKREIPDCISEKFQIGNRLDIICKEIDQIENTIERLYRVTNLCMEQYADTEAENSHNAQKFI